MAHQLFVKPVSPVAGGGVDGFKSDETDTVTPPPNSPDSMHHLRQTETSPPMMRLLQHQLQQQQPPAAGGRSPERATPSSAGTPSVFEFVDVTYRELRLSELLCLCFCGICCPRRTASTLAFWPPCPPTYQLYYDDEEARTRILLEDTALCPFSVDYLETVFDLEVFTATSTVHGNTIVCVHLSCADRPRYTILKSHTNAVDIGQDLDFAAIVGMECHCNVVVYDYSGYGRSTGTYSERNVYADAAAVFEELLSRFRLEPGDVVLCGHSIGTVPTVDLATKYDVAGVILICPLASALRTVFPCVSNTWFFDSFPNIDKVSKISSPVLVIHGTADKVIRIKDAVDIYRSCPTSVAPLWIDGAGHNDIQYHILFHERIRRFINVDLRKTKT